MMGPLRSNSMRLALLAAGLATLLSAGVLSAAETEPAEPAAPVTPAATEKPPTAEPPAPAAKEPPATPEDPAGEATPKEPPAAKPHSPPITPPSKSKTVVTLDDLRELPVLNRMNLSLEKGAELLADVRDNTFGYDEAAFYWLVMLASKFPPELMKPDTEGLPYSRLLAQPSSYRGLPVTIRGVYMIVTPFRVPALAIRKDIPTLYEVNIREAPLEQERSVATVIVIEDPMTTFRQFDEVAVKGYFYKIRQYRGSKGIGFAPMLIAQRLEPADGAVPPVADAGTTGQRPGGMSDQLALGIAFGLLAALIIAFFAVRQLGRAKTRATSTSPTFKFNLRRNSRSVPPVIDGPGSPGGVAKP